MGTLGSGNHSLEVTAVAGGFAPTVSHEFGLGHGRVVVSIHCGARRLGPQIGYEFLKAMAIAASNYGTTPPGRELAAPDQARTWLRHIGACCGGLRTRQPRDREPLRARRVRPLPSRPRVRALVRRAAQYLQGRATQCRGQESERLVVGEGATRALAPGAQFRAPSRACAC
ncbi:MAG: RtcB family protein [Alphaproteobacteria bacterium]|nr:RtcB family protein [Alphaproteobacteria bacterium]